MFALVALATRVKADGTTPKGIVRELQKTREPVFSSISTMESTWNPAKPLGPDNGIVGPGKSKYTLDEAGVVHLVFRSEGTCLLVDQYDGIHVEPSETTWTGQWDRRSRQIQVHPGRSRSCSSRLSAQVRGSPAFRRSDTRINLE